MNYRKKHIIPLIKNIFGIIAYSIPLYFMQVYFLFIISNLVFAFIAMFIGFFLALALFISLLTFIHSFFCIILNADEIVIR